MHEWIHEQTQATLLCIEVIEHMENISIKSAGGWCEGEWRGRYFPLEI